MRKAALPVAWSTNTPGADHGTEVHINPGADAAEFGERPGALVATYGSWAIGVMLAILALISLVCTYRLPETAGSALVSR